MPTAAHAVFEAITLGYLTTIKLFKQTFLLGCYVGEQVQISDKLGTNLQTYRQKKRQMIKLRTDNVISCKWSTAMADQSTILTDRPPTLLEEQPKIDLTDLITEDDEPVDNFPSAKQQRLLVEPLYSSAKLDRPFLADSNIALYRAPRTPPIVPDMFLSLGVQVADEWWDKENRSYLLWEFGKPPEVVIEIVSNEKGNEDGSKIADYAALGVPYYVIYDPQQMLSHDIIRVYQLVAGEYLLRPDYRLPNIGLSLTIWYGAFEDKTALWLRWCDQAVNFIPTGAERAEREQQRAAAAQQQAAAAQQQAAEERQHAAAAQQRAEQAQQRAERLAAQLRALGVEPEES